MNPTIERLLNGNERNHMLPFFWQHGEDERTLREMMSAIQNANCQAVCVESRPHPDFCGSGWWRDMDIILDEAHRRGMKVWILDDSHFPTGFANGAMADQPDELCRQSLCCRMYPTAGGSSLHLEEAELFHPEPFEKNLAEQFIMNEPQREFSDDRLLSVCAWNSVDDAILDLKPYIKGTTLDWDAPEGNWTVYVLHLSRNQGYRRSYINMMDQRSCKVLLDAVYEPHYAHYSSYFGNTIAGFFSDEPELGNGHLYEINDPYGCHTDYPWSRELEEVLRSRLDGRMEFLLPLLWENNGDPERTARLRYIYMDSVTRLVQKDFSEQIGNWCRSHGVEYIGHLIEDDNHHTRTGSSLGHYFRGLAGQDMSGIDDIGGQVFPQGEDISYYNMVFDHRNGEFYHYMLGKLASSAAAIEPRKKGRSMCEIFGNYGWSEGVRLEKYLADHFMVRGINHFVPHAFSGKAYPDPDCPPHFYAHGHNPQYRHFACLMTYMNRVCELISDGHHIAPAAVLYHAEADWTGKHMTADQVGHRLADAQIEYDYIPQDVFAQREDYHTHIEKGLLRINTQSYRVLIIPYSQFLTEALADGIRELKNAGVPVLYIDQRPDGLCSGKGDVPDADIVPLDALADTLTRKMIPDLSLSPSDHRIRYCRYLHEDGTEIYLFVNEGTIPYHGLATMRDVPEDVKSVYCYNAWDNCLEPAQMDEAGFTLDIYPLHSVILILDRSEGTPIQRSENLFPAASEKQEIPLSHSWYRSICRSIDYPDFRQSREVELPDTLAEDMPKFSGFARYINHFEAKKGEPLYLEITDAHEGVEVFLNGQSLGIQIAPPFRYRLSEELKDGENELRIEVATTLERENSDIPDMTGQPRIPTSLSGITGSVRLLKMTKR